MAGFPGIISVKKKKNDIKHKDLVVTHYMWKQFCLNFNHGWNKTRFEFSPFLRGVNQTNQIVIEITGSSVQPF